MSRVARAAYWTVPSLFCIALYWLGLKTWFLQDDFAWLSLNRQLQETGDLWSLLFTPQAQGTIRPLSERAFFLALHGLFGMDALPFRIVVFATQCANLLLLSSIALRLTGSRMAGFLAPVLWAANGTLATAMSWTSAYNQVLCGFFVLAAFRALLAYIDTGKRRYLALQWLLFLLGFGALEIMVVYPAMAAAYIGLMARRYWRGALCLFLPSVLYTAIHWHYAPKPASGPYAMHWTSSMLATLWTYWSYALGPANLQSASMALRRWMTLAGTLALTGGLAAVVWFQLRRGNRLGLFLLACFGILLGPVLPLRDHISEYYLTMPVFALAVLGAWGLRLAWLSRWPVRAAALALAGIYFASSLPAARALTTWRYHLGERVESLVAGLVRARELYPDKAILLSDLPSDVFWGALVDKAHWTAGVQNVYLVPGSESAIQAHPELASVSDYVLPV